MPFFVTECIIFVPFVLLISPQIWEGFITIITLLPVFVFFDIIILYKEEEEIDALFLLAFFGLI